MPVYNERASTNYRAKFPLHRKASGLLTTGLRTRESSRYREDDESDRTVTQQRRENTNEEDADRPFSDFAVRGLECMPCVAGSVPVITILHCSIITTRRAKTVAKPLCPQLIISMERINQSGKNPDECQN
jgi:hypothetical protein